MSRELVEFSEELVETKVKEMDFKNLRSKTILRNLTLLRYFSLSNPFRI